MRGRTYDVYAILPLNERLFARVSWTYIDRRYGGLTFPVGATAALGGTAPPVDEHLSALQLTLDATL